MNRWTKFGLNFLLVVFLLTSVWMRGLTYSKAVIHNYYHAQAVSNQISPERFQEVPQLPFVYFPTFSDFTFSTAEMLFGWYSERSFAQSIYSFPRLKSFIEHSSVVPLQTSTPIFIRVQSLRC